MKTKTILSVFFLVIIASTTSFAQSKGEKIEAYTAKLTSLHIFNTVRVKTGASFADMKMFCQFYRENIEADRGTFGLAVMNGTIKSNADIQNYANIKVNEYINLYNTFQATIKPHMVWGKTLNRYTPPTVQASCNPSCDNFDFENGTLLAWTACYAANNSTSSSFVTSTPTCTGPLGSVTTAANDPATSTNQVSIVSGTGFDPIAGSFIPVVCPTGGKTSVMIGDGTTPNFGVAILKQSFQITAANPNLTFMYAVVLENPAGHAYHQQPYFNVALLDSIGDTIGNYRIVSGPGLPGFKAFYYPTNADSVFCKTWTTVSVSMKKYMGQCVSLIATSYDCALGGHFGYAYFDATCTTAGITASSKAVCGKNVTLTAPGSGGSYKWTGPCILGSDSAQSAIVTCGGVYRVIIKDNLGIKGSIDTLYDTLKSGPPMTIALTSKTNVLCNGYNTGSAVVKVTSGGVKPFTYNWSPSGGTNDTATGLVAGAYTVTVSDSNGCTRDTTFNITQPTALGLTSSAVNAACGKNNGSASVVVSGGVKPYTYSWTPSGGTKDTAKGLSAGSYTCSVTDSNGCPNFAIALISDTTTLTDSLTIIDPTCNSSCNGMVIAKAKGGTPPYTYSWSTGATTDTIGGLCASSYTVTVTDSKSCNNVMSFTVSQPLLLSIVIDSSITGGCTNTVWATVSGGTPPYTYMWSNGATTDTVKNLCAGSYTITVTDQDTCKMSSIITIPALTGIVQTQSASSFKVYPVPAKNSLNVSIVNAGFTPELITIFDMTGRKVEEEKVSGHSTLYSIDVSKLAEGTYILKVSGNNNQKLARFTVIK
jgi:hypothetical protein